MDELVAYTAVVIVMSVVGLLAGLFIGRASAYDQYSRGFDHGFRVAMINDDGYWDDEDDDCDGELCRTYPVEPSLN